jgi:hypothetical protein
MRARYLGDLLDGQSARAGEWWARWAFLVACVHIHWAEFRCAFSG